MKIRMIETRSGSEDGFGVKRFHAEHEYDMAQSLACQFIKMGVAESLEPQPTLDEVTAQIIAESKARRASLASDSYGEKFLAAINQSTAVAL